MSYAIPNHSHKTHIHVGFKFRAVLAFILRTVVSVFSFASLFGPIYVSFLAFCWFVSCNTDQYVFFKLLGVPPVGFLNTLDQWV